MYELQGDTVQPPTVGISTFAVSGGQNGRACIWRALRLGSTLKAPSYSPCLGPQGLRSCREGHEWGRVYCFSPNLEDLAGLTLWTKPSVLPSSLGYLFHSRDEKQSLGRVYGYFPPNGQSSFTISGDKVWQPFPPRESEHRREHFLNYTSLIYCISQAMGKLGTSLSSGHVMVNGSQTQVLLVGAPTHGRS